MTVDDAGLLKVAEVIRREPWETLYRLSPTKLGTVIPAGAHAGRCELNTDEAALAQSWNWRSRAR